MGGKRLSIAVDCDEPLVDMNMYLQPWHNMVYRRGMQPLSRDDVFTFNLGVVWGVSREESNRRVLEFYRSEAFDRMTPTKGSVEGMEILAKANDALVLTSRIDAAVPKTRPFIDRYYSGKFSEIIFSGHYIMDAGSSKTKAEICLEKGIDILIEDCLRYALQCQEKGVPVVLLDCPWNREREYEEEGIERLPSGIVRADDWTQILECVDLFVKDRKRFYEIESLY